MIDKAKRGKRTFTVIAFLSALAAVATTAVVILLILNKTYIPMWFVLGFSAVCYYTCVFSAFASIDRGTAIRVLNVIDELGSYETEALAEKLGWNNRATEKFLKKLVKWGYIA